MFYSNIGHCTRKPKYENQTQAPELCTSWEEPCGGDYVRFCIITRGQPTIKLPSQGGGGMEKFHQTSVPD